MLDAKRFEKVVTSDSIDFVSRQAAMPRTLRSALLKTIRAAASTEYPYIFAAATEINGRKCAATREIAAAVNLLQISTFIVDDVLDRAAVRYGCASLYAALGENAAITGGVVLQQIALSRIDRSCQKLNIPASDVTRTLLLGAPLAVYAGQYLDDRYSGVLVPSVRQYLQTIELTTGAFIGLVAAAGGALGRCSATQQEALYQFGRHYGLALQMYDDVSDLTDPRSETGKPRGGDIRTGRWRLPALFAARRSPSVRRFLTRAFARVAAKKMPRATMLKCIHLIQEAGGIEEARRMARLYADRAEAQLQLLPQTIVTVRLRRLVADLVIAY